MRVGISARARIVLRTTRPAVTLVGDVPQPQPQSSGGLFLAKTMIIAAENTHNSRKRIAAAGRGDTFEASARPPKNSSGGMMDARTRAACTPVRP